MDSDKKKSKWKKSMIEWGVIIGVILLLYVTGWHTQVFGTIQRGMLATGLIKPSIPSMTADFPDASREFYFANEEGTVQSLSEYEGEVIFMNVWATWCPPCIAEMPSIKSLYDSLEGVENITFLIVSVDEDFNKAKEFMANRNFDLPIYHYRTRSPDAYESRSIPTTYIISKDGKMMMEKRGLAKYDTKEFRDFMIELSAL